MGREGAETPGRTYGHDSVEQRAAERTAQARMRR